MIMITFIYIYVCLDGGYRKWLQCFILFSKYTSNRFSLGDSLWASLSASLHLCMVVTNPSYMIRHRAPNVSYGQIITLPFPLALGSPVSLCRQEKQKSSGHTMKVQMVYCTCRALMTKWKYKTGPRSDLTFPLKAVKCRCNCLSDARGCLKHSAWPYRYCIEWKCTANKVAFTLNVYEITINHSWFNESNWRAVVWIWMSGKTVLLFSGTV